MARPEPGFMKGWTHTRAQELLSLRPSDIELLVQPQPGEGTHLRDVAAERGGKESTVRDQQETMGEGNLEAIRGKFEGGGG